MNNTANSSPFRLTALQHTHLSDLIRAATEDLVQKNFNNEREEKQLKAVVRYAAKLREQDQEGQLVKLTAEITLEFLQVLAQKLGLE